MSNKEPQYKTMPEHYVLCFNDECTLADECLHRLATRSRRQKNENYGPKLIIGSWRKQSYIRRLQLNMENKEQYGYVRRKE